MTSTSHAVDFAASRDRKQMENGGDEDANDVTSDEALTNGGVVVVETEATAAPSAVVVVPADATTTATTTTDDERLSNGDLRKNPLDSYSCLESDDSAEEDQLMVVPLPKRKPAAPDVDTSVVEQRELVIDELHEAAGTETSSSPVQTEHVTESSDEESAGKVALSLTQEPCDVEVETSTSHDSADVDADEGLNKDIVSGDALDKDNDQTASLELHAGLSGIEHSNDDDSVVVPLPRRRRDVSDSSSSSSSTAVTSFLPLASASVTDTAAVAPESYTSSTLQQTVADTATVACTASPAVDGISHPVLDSIADTDQSLTDQSLIDQSVTDHSAAEEVSVPVVQDASPVADTPMVVNASSEVIDIAVESQDLVTVLDSSVADAVVDSSVADSLVSDKVIDSSVSDTVVESSVVDSAVHSSVADFSVVDSSVSDTVVNSSVVDSVLDSSVSVTVVDSSVSDTVVDSSVVDFSVVDSLVADSSVADSLVSVTVVDSSVVDSSVSDRVVDSLVDFPVVEKLTTRQNDNTSRVSNDRFPAELRHQNEVFFDSFQPVRVDDVVGTDEEKSVDEERDGETASTDDDDDDDDDDDRKLNESTDRIDSADKFCFYMDTDTAAADAHGDVTQLNRDDVVIGSTPTDDDRDEQLSDADASVTSQSGGNCLAVADISLQTGSTDASGILQDTATSHVSNGKDEIEISTANSETKPQDVVDDVHTGADNKFEVSSPDDGKTLTDWTVTEEPLVTVPLPRRKATVTDQSSTDHFVSDQFVIDQYVTDQSVTDQSLTDHSVIDHSVIDHSVIDQPVTDQPLIDHSVIDQLVIDQSVIDHSVIDHSVIDHSVIDQLVIDQRVTDPSAADHSVTKQSVTDQSIIDQPVTDQSLTDQTIIDQSVINQPVTDHSVNDQRVTDQSIIDQSVINQPVTDQHVTDHSVNDQRVTDHSIIDQPVTDQSFTDQSIIDETVTDQPVTDQSIIDQSVIDQPVTDQSIIDQPVIDHSIIDQPVTDQPVTDQSVTDRSIIDQTVTDYSVGTNTAGTIDDVTTVGNCVQNGVSSDLFTCSLDMNSDPLQNKETEIESPATTHSESKLGQDAKSKTVDRQLARNGGGHQVMSIRQNFERSPSLSSSQQQQQQQPVKASLQRVVAGDSRVTALPSVDDSVAVTHKQSVDQRAVSPASAHSQSRGTVEPSQASDNRDVVNDVNEVRQTTATESAPDNSQTTQCAAVVCSGVDQLGQQNADKQTSASQQDELRQDGNGGRQRITADSVAVERFKDYERKQIGRIEFARASELARRFEVLSAGTASTTTTTIGRRASTPSITRASTAATANKTITLSAAVTTADSTTTTTSRAANTVDTAATTTTTSPAAETCDEGRRVEMTCAVMAVNDQQSSVKPVQSTASGVSTTPQSVLAGRGLQFVHSAKQVVLVAQAGSRKASVDDDEKKKNGDVQRERKTSDALSPTTSSADDEEHLRVNGTQQSTDDTRTDTRSSRETSAKAGDSAPEQPAAGPDTDNETSSATKTVHAPAQADGNVDELSRIRANLRPNVARRASTSYHFTGAKQNTQH